MNVAGLKNKDREFEERLKGWEIVSETWIDEKGWARIKSELPKEYKRIKKVPLAIRRSRKGRACVEE